MSIEAIKKIKLVFYRKSLFFCLSSFLTFSQFSVKSIDGFASSLRRKDVATTEPIIDGSITDMDILFLRKKL